MQPYVFPYIGYFQMISAVDKFVFYDDVNFIKQGWVNRNRILSNGRDLLFSIPLEKVSSFTLIKDTRISKASYASWRNKFERTLFQNYRKSENFEQVSALIKSILEKDFNKISELAIYSVITISRYLGLKAEFIVSSEKYVNHELERTERLLDICKQENGRAYINAIGGVELYSKDEFKKHGIELSFIKSLPVEYKQFKNDFVPWLSIIDVLMFNSPEEVHNHLKGYELI